MRQELDGRFCTHIIVRLAKLCTDLVFTGDGSIAGQGGVCKVLPGRGEVLSEGSGIKVGLEGRNVEDTVACLKLDRDSDVYTLLRSNWEK